MPIFFGGLALAPWVALLVALSVDSAEAEEGFIFAPIISFICLLAGGATWYLYYRLAGVCIALEDDALVYRSRAGEERLPFDRLLSLASPSVRYAGGWLTARTEEKAVRIPVGVKGVGELLRGLKTALDARGLSDRYDRAQLFRFLKTAEFADQSWERVYGIFWKYLLATLAGAALGVVLGLLASAHPLVIISGATVSALWPTGIYLATEILFGRRLAKLSEEASLTCPPRDREWERAVYRKVMAWGLGSYLVFAGLNFAVTWSWFGR